MSRSFFLRWLLLIGGLLALVAVVGWATSLPVTVHAKPLAPNRQWPPVPLAGGSPVQVTLRATANGLSAIWVPVTRPADNPVSGVLKDERGDVLAWASAFARQRDGWDQLVFTFPPQAGSAGRTFSLEIHSPLTVDAAPIEGVGAPGRFYPDGARAGVHQIAFETEYHTTVGGLVARVLGSLGAVGSERWVATLVVLGLIIATGSLVTALIVATWQAETPTA